LRGIVEKYGIWSMPTHCFRTILSDMILREAINRWRALPQEEKARRRWALIPLKVALSMEFEGEPVDPKKLQAVHANRPLPGLSELGSEAAVTRK